MPEEVKRLSEFERATEITPEALLFSSIADVTSESGYSTRAATLSLVAECIAKNIQFASDLETTSKSLIDAINEVNSNIINLRPKLYNYIGQLINGEGVDVKGYGTADIYLAGGIAKIDFTCKLETVVSSSSTSWGINRDLFKSAIGGVTINPAIGGSLIYANSNGTWKNAQIDFGGQGNPEGSRWKIGRIYKNASGQYVRGSWSTTPFAVGDIIHGTLYGRY